MLYTPGRGESGELQKSVGLVGRPKPDDAGKGVNKLGTLVLGNTKIGNRHVMTLIDAENGETVSKLEFRYFSTDVGQVLQEALKQEIPGYEWTIEDKARIDDLLRKTEKRTEESAQEVFYKLVRPHPTGLRGYSLEVPIPKDVRERVGVGRDTPLLVKVDGQNRIIYEKTEARQLGQRKRK